MVAIVPPIRVPDRIGIDVPTVAVPVHVDRAEDTRAIVHETVYVTARQTMTD